MTVQTLRVLTLVFAAAAGARPAHAAPARRGVPDHYERAAARAFDRAAAADAAGNDAEAIAQYRFALELVPHANPAFNLAELMRERYLRTRQDRVDPDSNATDDDWKDVEEAYRVYLGLASDPRERRAVLDNLARWQAAPVTLSITVPARDGLELDEAAVILDGELLARPGTRPRLVEGRPTLSVRTTPGLHTLIVVSPTAAAMHRVELAPLLPGAIEVRATDELRRGNVLLSGYPYLSLRGPDLLVKKDRRFDARPGRHVVQSYGSNHPCGPIDFVAPTGGVRIIHFQQGAYDCDVPVRQTLVEFPP